MVFHVRFKFYRKEDGLPAYTIDGTSAGTTGSANGSFYGTNAEAMGGVYQMRNNGDSAYVNGSFVSDSKTAQ